MTEKMRESPVVAFNLGMTLVDVRQAVQKSLAFTASRLGVDFDTSNIDAHLGRPIEAVLNKLAPNNTEEARRVCREYMGDAGVQVMERLPGADQAVEAVRRFGGRCVVLTSMEEGLAAKVLDRVGLDEYIDRVYGGLWSEQKAQVLGQARASMYVGEHPADMRAAGEAHVGAVGVATGAHSQEALRVAGADVVLPNIGAFASYYLNTLSVLGDE